MFFAGYLKVRSSLISVLSARRRCGCYLIMNAINKLINVDIKVLNDTISSFIMIQIDPTANIKSDCREGEQCNNIIHPIIIGSFNNSFYTGVCSEIQELSYNTQLLFSVSSKINLKCSNNFIEIINYLRMKESESLFQKIDEDSISESE